MKIKYNFLFFLGIVFQFCSCDSNHNMTGSTEDTFSVDDTAIINNILRRVSNKKIVLSDSIASYLTMAIELSKKCNYVEGQSKTLYLYGNLLYGENKYDSALYYYSAALNIAEKLENQLLKANCLERMASVNLTIGDDHLSLKLYYDALPLFEQTRNKEGIAKVYNIIGVYKSSEGEYDTATYYFQEAIKLNEEVGNNTGLIHNKGNLAFMYYNMGNTEKAKEIYISLIPKLIETGDSNDLSVSYYHLSIFSEAAAQPDSTLFYLGKAQSISEKLADTSILVTLYGKRGQIYLNQLQYDSAFYLLTKSAEMANAIDDYVTEKQALTLLIKIDSINHNFKMAIERYGQILILQDSVYNQRLRNNLESSELKYENQKKNNFIEVQKIELASSNKQKQFYLFLFLLLSLISLLLILMVILFRRNSKRKQELLSEKLRINELHFENIKQSEELNKLRLEKIEKEIKIKENEQVSNALALEQKNELLGMINKKFIEAMKDKGSISMAELNGLVSTIKRQVKDSSDTDLFNQKFNQLHRNFFDNLKKAHPNLTKSELRFCAYLKLNLTGSQIASILNVTPEAIRKTRYRIRKKINLSATDSLEVYISGL